MNIMLFLALRVLHVLLAAAWLGSTMFMSLMLMPVIDASGPSGGEIMVGLNKKGISAYFGAIGGITVLTGIYLFWHFTDGFDPAVSRTNAGMAYGIGGVAGVLAVIIGGSVVGRGANTIVELLSQLPKLSDAQKGPVLQQAGALKARVRTFGLVVIVLQVIALGLMAIAHYV